MSRTPKPLRRWRRKVDRLLSRLERFDLDLIPEWAGASRNLTPRNLRRWR